MEDEFEILAAKSLAGEATSKEQARLQELLAHEPALRQELTKLQETWQTLRQAAPVADAIDAPPVCLPDERLQQLLKTLKHGTSAPSVTAEKAGASVHLSRESDSAVLRFWRWFGHKPGFPAATAAAAALLIAVLVGAVLYVNRPAHSGDRTDADQMPIAYILGSQGDPDVRRDGARISVGAGTVVRATDRLDLPSGTEVRLITSKGMAVLRGPQRLHGAAAANVADSDDRTTNGMNLAMRTMLFGPAQKLPAAAAEFVVATRGGETIPLYSPMGATANLTPLFVWKSEPGRTYDMIIVDEFDAKTPRWRVEAVRSPLDFSKVEAWKGRPLAKNGLYRMRLAETGRPLTASEYTFRTLDVPSRTSAEPILNAVQIMTSNPARVGDALADLLTLPPAMADSELALRLKVLAFAQLGYTGDADATAAQLARLLQSAR
jgi:hypothetical protein